MSLSLMAVPVFLDTTNKAPQLFKEWLSMYNYGFPTLPTISIGTCALYLYTALRARALGSSWALCATAGIVTVVMVPFTWLFMWPTNDTIMALEKETRGKEKSGDFNEARRLVQKWNRTHFTRSLFPLAGALIGLYGLLQTA